MTVLKSVQEEEAASSKRDPNYPLNDLWLSLSLNDKDDEKKKE